jgi:hypothetical protein
VGDHALEPKFEPGQHFQGEGKSAARQEHAFDPHFFSHGIGLRKWRPARVV